MWNGVQKRIASSRGFIVRDGYPDPSWPEYFEDSYVVPTAVDYVCQLRPQPYLCSKRKRKRKKSEKKERKKEDEQTSNSRSVPLRGSCQQHNIRLLAHTSCET